jgi:hypothetical protein
MSLYKSSFKGYGCPYTNLDLRVTDIPINLEAKPRLVKLDRLVFSLLKVEEPCDSARIQLCNIVR